MGRSNEGAAMSRELVWIERQGFAGWGCSECAWVFNASKTPAGRFFDEMVRNFELQRDREFTLHVCADHPGTKNTKNKNAE
jgi:hypothetical protein